MDNLASWTDYLFAVSVLAVLLGGMGLFAYAVQKGWILQGMTGLRPLLSPQLRRLAHRETLVIDPRRRVVIVRADDTEHVLLLGVERETVLSSHPAKPDPVQPTQEPAV
jgi:flagellar protein FliO/FliZ